MSIIKKNKKNHNEIVLLLKANLNTIEVLISKYIKSTDILVMRICIKRI